MSVVVHPLQFGPDEDMARYPRDSAGDGAAAAGAGVDLLFRPAVAELYPHPPRREAARLHRALLAMADASAAGTRRSDLLIERARDMLDVPPKFAVDYLAGADPASPEPEAEARPGDVLLVAARLGGTRLLDNLQLPDGS